VIERLRNLKKLYSGRCHPPRKQAFHDLFPEDPMRCMEVEFLEVHPPSRRLSMVDCQTCTSLLRSPPQNDNVPLSSSAPFTRSRLDCSSPVIFLIFISLFLGRSRRLICCFFFCLSPPPLGRLLETSSPEKRILTSAPFGYFSGFFSPRFMLAGFSLIRESDPPLIHRVWMRFLLTSPESVSHVFETVSALFP